jgi:hypothetical protein
MSQPKKSIEDIKISDDNTKLNDQIMASIALNSYTVSFNHRKLKSKNDMIAMTRELLFEEK